MSNRETVWTFETARFRVTLEISPSLDSYDGDDENGEIQSKIDAGLYVMFDSLVRVVDKATGAELGWDSLGNGVYANAREFWTAHWDSPYDGRNTLALKARNTVICHYFPGMVREACQMAREALRGLQTVKVRASA